MIRSAIRLLEEEGKVYVRHGVGTFVVTPLPHTPNSLEKRMSVPSMIKNAGLEDGEKRERIKILQPTPEWQTLLQLQEDENVLIHEPIRTANDEPVVFFKNIFGQLLKGSPGSLHLEGNILTTNLKWIRAELYASIDKEQPELVAFIYGACHDPNFLVSQVNP